MIRASFLAIVCVLTAADALAENALTPGTPAADPPTVVCLGVYWPYTGDDNANASVAVRYRAEGSGDSGWRDGMPLFRIHPENMPPDEFAPKGASRAFAGSIFDLRPGTAYEMELSLSDPDGGSVKKTVVSKTRLVPAVPANLQVVNVAVGRFASAAASARPGQLLLLDKGVHQGNFRVSAKGTPEQPIVIRGASRDETVLDGGGSGIVLDLCNSAYVYVENLSVKNAGEAIRAHGSAGTVMRRCRVTGIGHVFRCTTSNNPGRDFYIADNVFEGPSKWPAEGIEDIEGVEVLGSGHVVCYNRISCFGDAVSVFRNPSVSIDFYNNDIDVATDDGIEMDYSDRNTRCFRNRIINCRVGVSVQPIYGGPCYVFRNECFNSSYNMFKLHNQPSGVLVFHNTSVRQGVPLVVWSGVPVRDHVFRNNLFIGTGDQISDWTSKNFNVDLDYDGYGPGKGRLKIGNQNYGNLQAAAKDGLEAHGKLVDPPFFVKEVQIPAQSAERVKLVELDLDPRSGAVDAGVRLPNVNDGFKGAAPDLGARECGLAPPVYGPRPEGVDEATEYEKAQSAASAAKPPVRSAPPVGAQAQKPEKKLPGDEEKAAAEKRFAELKSAIIGGIAAGKREQVYVDLAGSASRAQVIGADDAALKVSAMGLEVSMEWTKMSPRRFYGIARKYSEDHAALYEYCVGFGLTDEAKEEESQKE